MDLLYFVKYFSWKIFRKVEYISSLAFLKPARNTSLSQFAQKLSLLRSEIANFHFIEVSVSSQGNCD